MSSNDLTLAKIAELKKQIEILENSTKLIPIYVVNNNTNEININDVTIAKKGEIIISLLPEDIDISFDLTMVVNDQVIKYNIKIPINFINRSVYNVFVIGMWHFIFNDIFLGVYDYSLITTCNYGFITCQIKKYNKILSDMFKTFNSLLIRNKLDSYKWHLKPVILNIIGDLDTNYSLYCGNKKIDKHSNHKYDIYNSFVKLIFKNSSNQVELHFHCINSVNDLVIGHDNIKLNGIDIIESDEYFICNTHDTKYFEKKVLF